MAFLNAQEPVRIIIDEKVGLPSNEVYAIQEDSKGFVWLATNKGLIRYDGTSFKNYKHPEQRGLSIFEPFVDDKDRIWCMNISGQIFYTNGNNFELFTDLKDDLNGSLASIVVNKEYLVVSTFLKNIVVNLKTKEKRIEMFRKDNYDISFNYGFNKKYDQQLFQSLNEHIRIFESGAFKDFKRLPKDLIENEQRPEPIQLLKNGTGDFFILQQIRFKKPKFFWFKNDAWIELLVPDSFNNTRIIMPRFIDDRLWCTTDKGLFVFSINGDVLKQDAHYLKNHFTTDLFQDTDLNIWVSSLRKGLVVLPNIYVAKINLDQNLPKRLTATGNHELMIGFESGDVVQFNTQTQDQKLIDIPTPSSISNISYDVRNNRTFLFQKTHNYLYNNKEESFIKIENTIANVKDAAVVKSDTLIAALSGILIASSFQNNQFNKHNNYSFKKEKRGYAVLYDSITNTQYFAAVDGLYYKKNNSDLQLITYKGESLLTKKLLQDRQGNIWAATFKNGIFKIENNEVTQHLDAASGLNSMIINAIALDEEYLWIATENSLQRYDSVTDEIKSLSKNDGIPSFSIIEMTVIDNNLYMNTAQEVFQIDKEKVFKPTFIPEYYFTDVLIDSKKQQEQSTYNLPDKDTSTSISFNANGLRGLTSGSFQYRIKDHTDWTLLPQGTNNIQFASLPVGNITFQLQQSESKSIKELNFQVQQVFYKTIWFWTLVVAILILGIVLYYGRLLRFRESEKNKQLRNLALDNELVSLRLENLRSQMNPHFIFNALNSIQEYIVSNEKNLASSYLVKFSRLIRMYLEQSRENQISLKEEIHAMQLYLELEKVRFEDKLNYEINVDPSLNLENVKVPPLFIQPYVENALKHGLLHKKTDRKLEVNFDRDALNNTLSICVKDNGIGREQAAVIKAERVNYHKSFATYANNERVQLLNRKRKEKISVEIQDLKTDKGAACGTCVCISIPQQ